MEKAMVAVVLAIPLFFLALCPACIVGEDNMFPDGSSGEGSGSGEGLVDEISLSMIIDSTVADTSTNVLSTPLSMSTPMTSVSISSSSILPTSFMAINSTSSQSTSVSVSSTSTASFMVINSTSSQSSVSVLSTSTTSFMAINSTSSQSSSVSVSSTSTASFMAINSTSSQSSIISAVSSISTTSFMTINSTSVSVSSTSTKTPLPPIVVVSIRIVSSVTVLSNETEETGKQIRNEVARTLNIGTNLVSRVLLLFFDDDNQRTVVSSISFTAGGRRKRQESTNEVQFNAIEVDIQATDDSQAADVQNMINNLADQDDLKLTVNGETLEINVEMIDVSPTSLTSSATTSSTTFSATISSTSPETTNKGEDGLSNNAVSGIILGILFFILLVTLTATIIVLFIYKVLRTKTYSLDKIEMSSVKKYPAIDKEEEAKMPPE